MPANQEPGEALQTALAKLGQPKAKKPMKPQPEKKPAAKKPTKPVDPHSLDAAQAAFEKLTIGVPRIALSRLETRRRD